MRRVDVVVGSKNRVTTIIESLGEEPMKMAKMVDSEALGAARKKYLLLGREIEALSWSIDKENMMHTHSKLGIFIEQAVGEAWRGNE